ncbi:MAG: phenylalanine--tRNA ligase subunit beta [Candidatus Omnitrophica bacterium]|nr:phenylalanine--tRNA ligase subunit beta [Candidatus Omnitrophota bacterium]
MRFSLNFIQEFLKVDIQPRELASLLTSAGMEVERLEKGLSDWIFDIEVTTNRYDWLSILGISREIAAVLGKKVKVNYPAPVAKHILTTRDIIIEDKGDCPYYIGRRIEGVKVSASCAWLQQRILNCGLTPVNDIVDITNYSMLKWGNPLHAFDADKLEGNIYIRRAKKNESLVGIDGKERVLDKENLVIADNKKVIALAGIIGAKNTEVTEATKNIFLEAAVFSPLTVRRSRRSVGLDTESSYRFQRAVPPHLLEHASCEAAKLIADLSGGKNKGFKAVGKRPRLIKKNITISLNSLGAYLGILPLKSKVKKILENLDFKVKDLSKDRIVVLPSESRFDIKSEVDVYEEFSRIYGYDKIPAQIPFLKRNLAISSQADYYHSKGELANLVALLGFKEIVTYSLEEKEQLKIENRDVIELINPLRSQENALRTNLLFGMVKSLRHNLNRTLTGTSNLESLRLFEIADTYSKTKKGFLETPTLALAISGKEGNFFLLKGALERIFSFLDINNFEFKEDSLNNFTNSLKVNVGNYNLGFLGKLDQQQKKNLDLKEDLFFAQLDLSICAKIRGQKKYKPYSPYPSIWRDISIFLKKSIKFEEIERIIKAKGGYLADLAIIDIYKGKDIPPGHKAFTLRIFYQSTEKTLTSSEVDSFHNQIRQSLSQQEGLKLR